MQYSEGRIGRVFVVRIDDGEDLLEEIRRLVAKENISHGIIHLIGALRNGMFVTGPQKPVIPPLPHMEEVSGGWEIVGCATILPGKEGPAIHLHANAGREREAILGCLRDQATAYLIVEAVILEFVDIQATRAYDEKTQVHLPVLEKSV